jgi:hypothetical protein
MSSAGHFEGVMENQTHKPITVGEALQVAAAHPGLAEHHNKFVQILKDIGDTALGVVLFPVMAVTISKDRDEVV